MVVNMLINKDEVKKLLKQYISTDNNTLNQYTEVIVKDAERIVLSLIKGSAHKVPYHKIDTKA
jgi:Holliday junction resolvasome RuvABC DNA-binding subunit